MSEADRACIVLVTAPSVAVAAELARALVEERLAACGNILPGVRSIYRWQGEVQDESEVLLLLKTVPARVPALTARVVALHPYDVPEVVTVPLDSGLDAYVTWVEESVSRAEETS